MMGVAEERGQEKPDLEIPVRVKNWKLNRKPRNINKIIKQIQCKFKNWKRKTIKLETVYLMVKIHILLNIIY